MARPSRLAVRPSGAEGGQLKVKLDSKQGGRPPPTRSSLMNSGPGNYDIVSERP